jgi:hypothetical protein
VNLFALDDLKVFLPGAAVALATGLLLGGSMQPHLEDGADRPAGPQMFADWAGDRSTGPFDPGTTFVAYRGNMPDYVMGTDWKKSMTASSDRAAVSTPPEEVAAEDATMTAPEEPTTLRHVAYDEPAPPAHAYPSLGGAAPTPHAATDGDVAVEDDTLPAIES